MEKVAAFESSSAPRYAKTCGLLAMVLSVVAVILPVSGILAITPVSIVLGVIALVGGMRGVSLGVLAICSFHLISSSVFWASIDPRTVDLSLFDRTMAYFDAVGIVAMCALVFRQSRK